MTSKSVPMELEGVEIDEALYSRQLYVMGHEAQLRMSVSNILLVGLNGLGVETAKNVILAGVKSLSLYDETNVSYDDFGANFFLSKEDIGLSRSKASSSKLAELNPYVDVSVISGPFLWNKLTDFTVVVVADVSTVDVHSLSDYCHENRIAIVVANVQGVYGSVFCDFGKNFVIHDVNGETFASSIIASITKTNPAVVTVLEETRHNLESGDLIVLSDIEGMTELNQKKFEVTVKDPYTLEIPVDSSTYSDYVRGGYINPLKKPVSVNFHPYTYALKHPGQFICDFVKIDRAPLLHLAFQ